MEATMTDATTVATREGTTETLRQLPLSSSTAAARLARLLTNQNHYVQSRLSFPSQHAHFLLPSN